MTKDPAAQGAPPRPQLPPAGRSTPHDSTPHDSTPHDSTPADSTPSGIGAKEARKAQRQRRQAEDRALRVQRRELRRSKDVAMFHGHHVVSGPDLQQVFAPAQELDNPIQFRHRLVHGVILTALAALVIAGVVFAVLLARGDLVLPFGQSRTTAALACPAATFDYPANKDVRVNVYNSTLREGLAASVAAELKDRGFQVGVIANKTTNYAGPAVIVSGAAGQSAAFNLQRNLAGTDYVQDDRTDASVDVYLASGFSDLVAAAKVDQTPGLLSCPQMSPRATTGVTSQR